jgi:hypothetical protein
MVQLLQLMQIFVQPTLMHQEMTNIKWAGCNQNGMYQTSHVFGFGSPGSYTIRNSKNTMDNLLVP